MRCIFIAIISVARYEGKIETEGTSMNHSITITSLTVDHSGVFTCVYKKSFDHRVVQRLHRFHTCVKNATILSSDSQKSWPSAVQCIPCTCYIFNR